MPTKALPPTAFRLMPGDDDFTAAWEYLPSDAKKALSAALPKLPTEGVGAQLRQRVRNAVVAAAVLFKHGRAAYANKHGQVDLFTGSSVSRRPPSKHAMHIAKRLMGSDEKSLRVCLKRLEKVVYAYNASGHGLFPSDRILDETVEWAFAVRVRKPKPFAGAWLLGQRDTAVPTLPWEQVVESFKRCSLWPEACDIAWYAWCWQLMTEAGLTEFRNAKEHDLVRLRAVAMQHIYADYCLIVFSERSGWTGERLYMALGGQRLAWDRHAFMTQRADVSGAILGHYKRLDHALRNKGRLQFEGGATDALLEDLETTLPLMGNTLKEHFKDPSTWVDRPGSAMRRVLYHSPFEERRKLLAAWLMGGMQALEVTTYKKTPALKKS